MMRVDEWLRELAVDALEQLGLADIAEEKDSIKEQRTSSYKMVICRMLH
jgi:hypothetical protein